LLAQGVDSAPAIMADGATRRPNELTLLGCGSRGATWPHQSQAGTPGMSLTRTPIASQRLRRHRRTKIIATLGPASSTTEIITRLFQTGADVFRLNFSHGSHEDHAARIASIREIEKRFDRPIGILADVQGPKLRVGRFAGGKVHLQTASTCRTPRSSPPPPSTRTCCSTTASCACASPTSARTTSRPRSSSAAPCPTGRASTCRT
jgi:hypothetical protein